MDDGRFIEYLLEKRVMRKTKNTDNLHNIYASKYLVRLSILFPIHRKSSIRGI